MTKGRRPLPWIKLWFDMLGDPKMTQLSAAEKWCWVGILLLAGESPCRGKLMLTETKPMTEKDIFQSLSLSQKEKKMLKSCVLKMIELNSLRWNENGCLEVIHFKERQEVYPSDFEDYHKKPPEKLLKNSDKTPEKVLKEGEGRGERKDITPLTLVKGARKERANSTVNEIFSEMRRFLGYPEKVCGGEALPAIEENQAMTADRRDPIPNYGKEGKAITRMLTRGFTREEILDCWRSKVSQRGGEFVSMTWVNEDIGKKGVKAGEQQPGKGVRPKPRQERRRPITRIPGR